MANAPTFAVTPNDAVGQVSTANANWDGTGTVATVLTAGASGTKINEIVIEGVGTTVASIVNLFLHDGTNFRLFDSFIIPAITASTTVPPFRTNKPYDNLVLPTGWSLRASVTVGGQTLNVVALAADL